MTIQLIRNKSSRQIIILTVISFFTIWALFITLFYNYSVNSHETTTLERLKGIANAVGMQINGDQHEKLFNTYLEMDEIGSIGIDTIYDLIHKKLSEHQMANMLKSPIYTLRMSDDERSYEFGVTSQLKPYYRHKYKSFHLALNKNYKNGGMINRYTDEFGMWLSAFEPIKNASGRVVGVVMVDEKQDQFFKSLYDQIYKALLSSLAIFLISIAVLIWQLQRILLREEKNKQLITQANYDMNLMNVKLTEANNKLNELDNFRKEMITNVSHDLRTPLSSIIGYLELLKTNQNKMSDDEKSKYTDIAFAESKRLNRLVSDLFELTKFENGQIILNFENFNIYELVNDVVQKYELKLREKNVTTYFDIEDSLGLVNGDIKYIDRVFQNLLDNAVKFVPNDGFIKISIHNNDDKIQVKVCNSGPTVSQKDLGQIFDRYYVGAKDKSSGTGLGLAISKKICELHQCTMDALSINEVTSFFFTVPKSNNN